MSFGELRSLLNSNAREEDIDFYDFADVVTDMFGDELDKLDKLDKFTPYILDNLSASKRKIILKEELKPRDIIDVGEVDTYDTIRNWLYYNKLLLVSLIISGRYNSRDDILNLLPVSYGVVRLNVRECVSEVMGYDFAEILSVRSGFEYVSELEVFCSDPSVVQAIVCNNVVKTLKVTPDNDSYESWYEVFEEVLSNYDIKELHIVNMRGLDVNRILPYLEGVEVLNLSGSSNGPYMAIEISKSTYLNNLKSLKLDRCGVNDEGVIALVNAFDDNLSSLEDFSLLENSFNYTQSGGAALLDSRLGYKYDPNWYLQHNSEING